MARGWESKSVADQIEAGKQRIPERGLEHSPKGREWLLQLESLRLSRSRTLAQLERATNPAHREILLKGLRAIEEQVEKISKDLGAEG